MTKFELFCMLYYAIDAYFDQNKNEVLRQFLSDANPFLFEDTGSADPAVFEEFSSFVEEDITTENSYDIALSYISKLNIPELVEAFSSIDASDWQDGLESYLSNPHKG